MSRRRRKGNKLIGRILMISVGVHIIAIPVLAKFGAFEKIRERFTTQTVIVTPPPAEKIKEIAKKAAPKKTESSDKKAKSAGQKAAKQAPNNLPQPNVVAAKGGADSSSADGPTVDPNGTGKVGVPPTPPSTGATNSGPGGGSVATPPPPPTPPTPPVIVGNTNTTTETTKPTPPPPTPHVPVFAAAEPISQPLPDIPDDFRLDALDRSVTIDMTVDANGSPSSATVAVSCGIVELDQIALKAVQKWKFRPASRDGEAIAGKVRVHVQFKVDSL